MRIRSVLAIDPRAPLDDALASAADAIALTVADANHAVGTLRYTWEHLSLEPKDEHAGTDAEDTDPFPYRRTLVEHKRGKNSHQQEA